MRRDQQINLGVGEAIVAAEPNVVTTVIGSCVSVCILSPEGVGGITHYVMPYAPPGASEKDQFRYGDAAIRKMVATLADLRGGQTGGLRAKIVGGAVLGGGPENVGPLNVALARQILGELQIPLVGEDVGGSVGRTLIFYTDSGRLRVQRLEASLAPAAVSERPATRTAARARPKRVMIIDDSKTIRELLTDILSKGEGLEVVATAADPIEAERLLSAARPDVITLDIHMPRMDGITFLERQMRRRPLPVVMISAQDAADGDYVLRALEIGAVDYIKKPKLAEMADAAEAIREKIRMAAEVSLGRLVGLPASNRLARGAAQGQRLNLNVVVAIGASTGGTEAIKQILLGLPAMIPPIVIVQHIPPLFSAAFARRLNDLCPFDVKEGSSGDELRPGRVVVAPGGKQMSIALANGRRVIAVDDGPAVNRHKPSVDVLFGSVARVVGKQAIGVILTGMGQDGAAGLKQMKDAGAHTIAQDEPSSIVYGMPKAAYQLGAASEECGLDGMAERILNLLSAGGRAA